MYRSIEKDGLGTVLVTIPEEHLAAMQKVVGAARAMSGGTARLCLTQGNERDAKLWGDLHEAVAEFNALDAAQGKQGES